MLCLIQSLQTTQDHYFVSSTLLEEANKKTGKLEALTDWLIQAAAIPSAVPQLYALSKDWFRTLDIVTNVDNFLINFKVQNTVVKTRCDCVLFREKRKLTRNAKTFPVIPTGTKIGK